MTIHVFASMGRFLVSCVLAKGKVVLMLSFMHHETKVESETQNPEIILHYNATKGGVNNLDHLVKMFATRKKINKWPMTMFMNVVDVVAIAAFIIWIGNFLDWKCSELGRHRRIYLRQLWNALVMPHMKSRADTATS